MEEGAGNRRTAWVGIDGAIREGYILLDALDRRTLAALRPPLTPAQYHALAGLASQPTQNLGELAGRLLCDRANASGLIERLVVLGLADRVADPRDRRRVILSLTPAGQEALRAAAEARRLALQRVLASLEDAGAAGLEADLSRLVTLLRAADTPRADPPPAAQPAAP